MANLITGYLFSAKSTATSPSAVESHENENPTHEATNVPCSVATDVNAPTNNILPAVNECITSGDGDSICNENECDSNRENKAKKRVLSDDSVNVTGADLKRTNRDLNDSISDMLNDATFESDPHWVPLIFKALDSVQREVKVLSEKFESFESFKSDITARVDDLQKSVEFISDEFDETKKNFDTLKTNTLCDQKSTLTSLTSLHFEVESLKESNAALQKTVEMLEKQVDNNEQHSRNECLLIHGVPENTQPGRENCKAVFASEVTRKVGVEINETFIKRAHRYGPRRRDGKPRPIIARFWDSACRNHVYASKKNCKGKKIAITENLTKRKMKILRDATQKYGTGKAWSQEGRIYAQDGSGNVCTVE